MRERHIVVVGGGPLCTYALERLAALLPGRSPRSPVRVHVFERTGWFGAGATHSHAQATTSYMNRVASQIAFAADESNAGAGPLLPAELRPTFYEWARARYDRTGDARFDVQPTDVPLRYLHGLALAEAFERYVGLLRDVDGVEVELHVAEVVDVRRTGGGEAPFEVVASGPPLAVPADHVLFVTGHSTNRPRHTWGARYVHQPYPLEDHLGEDAVPAGSAVGLLGFGLTAIDVLLHLTEGRGGRFEPARGGDAAALAYVRSGREPRVIVPVSPSGLPTATRPRNVKAADGSGRGHTSLEHRPVFLTVDAVHALRRSVGRPVPTVDGVVRQLDFDAEVFPLVVLEMAYVYYSTLLGERFGALLREAVDDRYRRFLREAAPDRDAGIGRLLEPVDRLVDDVADPSVRGGRFEWRRFFDPVDAGDGPSGDVWSDRLVAWLRADVAAAAAGNLANPTKAACDGVWRDLRGVIAEAVDFGGLTPASHERFTRSAFRYYTRMSNGAGVEAMRKVLALVEAALVDVSVGPRPEVAAGAGGGFRLRGAVTAAERHVDVLVEGKAHAFDPVGDAGPLYPNLVRRGLVQARRHPGADEPADGPQGPGLDLTRSFHPVQADGTVEPRLTFLGAPAEGAAFFQLSAARPRSASSVLDNVAAWARSVVATADEDGADGRPVSRRTTAGPARGATRGAGGDAGRSRR